MMSGWAVGYAVVIGASGVIALWLVYLLFRGNWASRQLNGDCLGLVIGFAAALAYTLLWTVTVGVAYLITSDDYAGLGEVIQMHIAFLLNAVLFGLIPSTLFGGFTGWLIGHLLRQGSQNRSRFGVARIGLLVCLGCTFVWHLFILLANAWLSGNSNPFASISGLFYLLFIGLPSLIYLAIGLRWSLVLWQRINKEAGIDFHSFTGLTSPLKTDIL